MVYLAVSMSARGASQPKQSECYMAVGRCCVFCNMARAYAACGTQGVSLPAAGFLVVRGVLMVPSVIVSECTARGAVHGDGPSSNHKPIRLCAFMNGSRSLLRNNPTVAVIVQPSFRLTHVDIVSMVQLKWGGKENRWSIHWVYWPFTSKR